MVELVTDAIVIGKRISGEQDSLAFLFTLRDGVIPTIVAAGANITSKLTPYLNTLSFITARIVGKNNYRLAGAMEVSICHSGLDPESRELNDTLDSRLRGNDRGNLLQAVCLIKELLPPFVPEPELWQFLRGEIIGDAARHSPNAVRETLRLLGYDPQFAQCGVCGAAADLFAVGDATFYCNTHGAQSGKDTFPVTATHESHRRA